MKANKVLKRLAKIEESMSDVMERYSAERRREFASIRPHPERHEDDRYQGSEGDKETRLNKTRIGRLDSAVRQSV